MHSPSALPDDLDALRALVIDQQQRLAQRDSEIEHLKLVIAKLQRMQFGRRGERLDETIDQLQLALEELEAVRAERVTPEMPLDDEAPANAHAAARAS